ncbi:MAG: HAMP domain-containing sensor histidine kinase [Anaeromyxobacteraceae bacterium]
MNASATAHAEFRPAFEPRGREEAFADAWRRTRRWVYVACDAAHLLLGVLLWADGYPTWRVATYGLALAVSVALHVWVELPAARAREASGDGSRRAGAERLWLAAMLLEIAVTGGVRSPLFPSNVAAIPLNVQQFGWRRGAGASSLAILGCAVAFLVAPAAWTGPTVPGATYWLVLASAVLATGGTSLHYRALLARVADESVRDALRARETAADQAIARARELEQLGAKISHELKNPLSAVKTLVQVSARGTTDSAMRERLEVVEREVKRMEHTLRHYLTFSSPADRLDRAPLALSAVVDDVLSLLSGRAREAGIALERRGDVEVEADARRLSDAVLNLVANAVEASAPGGRVTVELSAEGDAARIAVRDTGRGMARDVLERIGTPFFTTRSEGTGLGVALARAAFVQHGGALTYQSAPGEGTLAAATFPARTGRTGDGARARGG